MPTKKSSKSQQQPSLPRTQLQRYNVMFLEAVVFNQDLSHWDVVSKVKDAQQYLLDSVDNLDLSEDYSDNLDLSEDYSALSVDYGS